MRPSVSEAIAMKKITTLVLLLFVSLGYAEENNTASSTDDWEKFNNFEGFTPEYPNKFHEEQSFRSFLKYASTYKFNVTILITENSVWSEGYPKSMDTISLTLSNKEHLTESEYNKDIAYTFLKQAEDENLTANARFVTIKGDPLTTDFEHFVTNNAYHVPKNLAYNTMFNVQEGVRGYIPTDPDHFVRYNFHTETNMTTIMIFADSIVDVKDCSNFNDEEQAFAKKMLNTYTQVIDDDEDIIRMVVEAFDTEYSDYNWNAFVGGGKFALDSKKYVVLNVFDTDYTIIATK